MFVLCQEDVQQALFVYVNTLDTSPFKTLNFNTHTERDITLQLNDLIYTYIYIVNYYKII